MKRNGEIKLNTIFLFLIPVMLFISCGKSSAVLKGDELAMLQPSGEVVNGVREIKVLARQYEFIPDVIVVRTGENVKLDVTSSDVTNGFSLPAYGINKNINLGKTEVITFTAKEAGDFPISCSVFCGSGHMSMKAKLVVINPEK
jgi:cytochrome c oxidase subunit II